MTLEEACRLIDPATDLDALAEIEYYNGFKGKDAAAKALHEAGCRAYREHGCSCPDQRYDLNPDGSVNMAICQRSVKRPPQSWCYVEEKDIVDLLYSNKEENNA